MMNARYKPVAIWVAGLLVCLAVVTRTEFNADLSAFLPRSPSPAQQVLVEQLRDGLVSRLILIGIEGAPQDSLARLSKTLAERLNRSTAFLSIANGEADDLEKDRALLRRNRYLLSAAVTADRFTPAALRKALETDLGLLRSEASVLVKRTIPDDPTGELLRLLSEWGRDPHPSRHDDVWFSPNGERALLVAQTRAAGFDIDRQEGALKLIEDDFEAAKSEVADAHDARLIASGPGVFSVGIRANIKKDAERLSLIAIVMVSALLWSVYRSLRMVGLSIAPVASGILAGIAAVSICFGSVHGITLGFGVTLIGEAVDYAIYLFSQTAPGRLLHETLPRIWPTLRLGVMTSVCGFGTLLFSSFSGLAQLGLFSVVGLIVAAGVTRWVLPHLMSHAPSGGSTRFAAAVLGVVGRASSLRYPLMALVVAGAAFLFIRHDVLWDDQLASLSPIPAQKLALDEQLRRDIGAPDVRYLFIVSTPDEQRTLAQSERFDAFLQGLVGRHVIEGFDSPSRYLPSKSTQKSRQEAIPEPATLRTNLQQALDGLPFQPDLFTPFLSDASAAKTQPLLDRGDFENTHLMLKLASLLFQREGRWRAILPLRGVADTDRLASEVAAYDLNGATFLDLKGESDQLYRTYRHQALLLSFLGGVAIVVLLLVSLRSPSRAFQVVLPLAGAVVVTAALLIAGGQKLTVFNLVGLLLVIGVGSNYSLFFEQRGILSTVGSSADQERALTSVILANLCTVIGFGVLSFSSVPVLHGIGATVGLGAVLSLLFSIILFSRRKP